MAVPAAPAGFAIPGGELIKTVRKFHGTVQEDIDEFIGEWQAAATTITFATITDQIRALASRLRGIALYWLRENFSNSPVTGAAWASMDAFFNAMRARFQQPVGRYIQQERLWGRLQGEFEDVHSYGEAIMKLCQRVDPAMPETSKISNFIRGLRPRVKETVLTVGGDNFTTLLGAIRVAMRTEQANRIANGGAASVGTTTQEASVLTQVLDALKQVTEAVSRSNRGGGGGSGGGYRGRGSSWQTRGASSGGTRGGARGRGRGGGAATGSIPGGCFVCGKAGHFARECPQRAEVGNADAEQDEEAEEGEAVGGVNSMAKGGGKFTPTVAKGAIAGIPVTIGLDGGASVCLINNSVVEQLRRIRPELKVEEWKGVLLNMENEKAKHPALGLVEVEVEIGETKVGVPAIIVTKSLYDVVVGTNVMLSEGMTVDYNNMEVRTKNGGAFKIEATKEKKNTGRAVLVARGDQVIGAKAVAVVSMVCGQNKLEGQYIVEPHLGRSSELAAVATLDKARGGAVRLVVENTSERRVVIKKGQVMGVAERLREGLERELSKPDGREEWDWNINPLLSKEQQERYRELLEKYRDGFTEREGGPNWGLTTGHEYHIELKPGARPKRKRVPRRSPLENEFIRRTDESQLKAGIIRPSESPWVSLVVLTTKPDGGIRTCVDLRDINEATLPYHHSIPRSDDIID